MNPLEMIFLPHHPSSKEGFIFLRVKNGTLCRPIDIWTCFEDVWETFIIRALSLLALEL